MHVIASPQRVVGSSPSVGTGGVGHVGVAVLAHAVDAVWAADEERQRGRLQLVDDLDQHLAVGAAVVGAAVVGAAVTGLWVRATGQTQFTLRAAKQPDVSTLPAGRQPEPCS